MGLVDDALRKALSRAIEDDVIYRSDAKRVALSIFKRSPSKSIRVWYSISALPSATQNTTWLGNYCPYTCQHCGKHTDSKTPFCAYCGRKAVNYENRTD